VIVLDASAAVEWAVRSRRGQAVEARLVDGAGLRHAPHLIDLEVAHALRRLVASGRLSLARAEEALIDFSDLALVRHAHDAFVPRIWELRDNLTPYDAAYVALAETLDVPIVTCDRKSASAHGHHALFEVVD
jgi:predicted nucleic acid-binding protein